MRLKHVLAAVLVCGTAFGTVLMAQAESGAEASQAEDPAVAPVGLTAQEGDQPVDVEPTAQGDDQLTDAEPAVQEDTDTTDGESAPAPVDTATTHIGPVVQFGTAYTLPADTETEGVVVIFHDATIRGRVAGDLVVVLGNLVLEGGASVERSVVVVGGDVRVADGVSVGRELVVVAGDLESPVGFSPGREQVVIAPGFVGDRLRGIVPWITYGLLLGRPIVPSLPWVWAVVLVFLAFYAVVTVAFPQALRACADTLAARPLGAFFVGVLTLLLFPPLTTLLAVSVVGVLVIPFAACALVVGWMFGKASVARWIGAGIVGQDSPDDRLESLRSLLIGFAVITVLYMVPLLGFASWALVGVLGLGTATLTVVSGLRRERPAAPAQPEPAVAFASAPAVAPAAAVAEVDAAAPAGDEGEVGPVVSDEPPSEPSPQQTPAARPVAGAGGALVAQPRATFLDRLAAGVLDVVLVAIAYNLMDFPGDWFLFLLFAYFVGAWAWKGTTVGGLVTSLRVVRTDGAPLRFSDALVRGLASLLSFAALGLGFFWILFDSNRDRQAWHDTIAATLVVRVPRDWPLP